MKIYHWLQVGALADWADGEVIAVAENLEDAVEAACKKAKYDPSLYTKLREELMSKAPVVIKKFPWATLIEGSS